MHTLLGLLFAAVVASILAVIYFSPADPRVTSAGAVLVQPIRTLRLAQTEKYLSDGYFAETNSEAQPLVGRSVQLGPLKGAPPFVEMNVVAGGVIELLLDAKDRDGARLRAAIVPELLEGAVQPVRWHCMSANWGNVRTLAANCTFSKTAWDDERRHVAKAVAMRNQIRSHSVQDARERQRERDRRYEESLRFDEEMREWNERKKAERENQ